MPAPNLAALNRSADQAKRPVALNDGIYFGKVIEQRIGESDKKRTPYVEYTVELTHPHPDVDLQGVNDKGEPVTIDPAGKKMRFSFWFTEDSEYRFVDFIKSLGITTEGRTYKELIPQALQQQVMVDVSKQPSKSGEGYFNEIRSMRGLHEEPATPAQEIAVAQGRRRQSA